MLKKLLENPHLTQSNQSQLTKAKSVESFRGVLRTHSTMY